MHMEWCRLPVFVLNDLYLLSSNPFENLVTRLQPDKMSGRMMKYPYTFTSKLAQFPLQYYMKNVWLFKYYALGIGMGIPVFLFFQRMCKLLYSI